LQLIFVLLHCSVDEGKKRFLENMLQGFKVFNEEDKRVLAIIEIWDGYKIVKLEFFSCNNFCLQQSLGLHIEKDTINEAELKMYFFALKQLKIIKKEIFYLEDTDDYDSLIQACKKSEQFEDYCEPINECLQSQNMTYICNYSSDRNSNDKEDQALFCHFNNIDTKETEVFLKQLSEKIFLAAPSTQIFLFLPPNSRKLLFGKLNNEDKNYYGILESARYELQGLFTYDFLAVELLIESFKDARDRDFREAIKTGNYGNSYQALINDLNLLLGNKRINLDEDFAGVNFQLYNNGETIELYAEDLSHGELKRLSIYAWLQSRNIEDAIVLMDEIEIAFHPDWQYQIISDLKEWGPSNQYILATHSYALCEALTPAHVKEIEPKLIKQESNITNES
jgi:hypothetical protein